MPALMSVSYMVSRTVRTLLACALVMLSQCSRQAFADPTIELTRRDLFASTDWSSKDVSVLGFHLGMTKEEARKNAEATGTKLTGEGARNYERPCSASVHCEVVDHAGFSTGIFLEFGGTGQVSELLVGRMSEDTQPGGGHPWVHWRFKGLTYELFSNYSDRLRQKVLGAESNAAKDGFARTFTFHYSRRGVVLRISPCPHQPRSGYCGEISLGFVPPVSP